MGEDGAVGDHHLTSGVDDDDSPAVLCKRNVMLRRTKRASGDVERGGAYGVQVNYSRRAEISRRHSWDHSELVEMCPDIKEALMASK